MGEPKEIHVFRQLLAKDRQRQESLLKLLTIERTRATECAEACDSIFGPILRRTEERLDQLKNQERLFQGRAMFVAQAPKTRRPSTGIDAVAEVAQKIAPRRRRALG